MGGAGAGAKAGAAANATLQSGAQPDAQQEAATLDDRDAETAAAVSRATAAKSAANGAAATPSLAAAPPAAPHHAGGNDGQQGGTSRKRDQSGQQSSGPGSRGNNSQQGSNRGTGQEGIKRARGSSSLMLAVPMEDRVIGTVNAGSVSSTTRNAPPRPCRPASSRRNRAATGRRKAGRILHGPRTVQEDRMLERYFRPRRGGPVDAATRTDIRTAVRSRVFLDRVNAFALRIAAAQKGGRLADQRTAARGQGSDFADFKPYVAGDDLRAIDWNIYSRLGKAFVGCSRSGRICPFIYCSDVSRSMFVENAAAHRARDAGGAGAGGDRARPA